VGRAGLCRAEEKKEKKIGWARWAGKRVGCLFVFFLFFSIPFLSFLFQTFTQNLFKIFLNQLLTTQSIKTHAFNMMHKHLVSLIYLIIIAYILRQI
jgi:hypothetical protein